MTYLLAAIRRQFFVLLLIPLLIVGLGIAYLVSADPQYTATASIGVRLDDAASIESSQVLDTHAELIQSNRITAKVIEDLSLDEVLKPSPGRLREAIARARQRLGLETQTAWSEADTQSFLIRQVQGGLDVERIGNTSMIAVRYTTPQRGLSVDVATAFAATYVAEVSTSTDNAMIRRTAHLEQRADEVKNMMLATEDTVRRLLSENNYVATSAADLSDRVSELRQQLSDISASEAETRARLALLTESGGFDVQQATALQSEGMLEIYSDMLSASQKLALLAEQPGVSRDTLTRLEDSIDRMRTSLERGTQRIRNELELDLAIIAARSATIQRELKVLQDFSRSAAWANLLEAQREAEVYDRIYQANMNNLENIQRNDVGADVRLVSEARPPINPSFPNYRTLLVLFLTMGIVLAVGIAMYREWMRRYGVVPASRLASESKGTGLDR